MLYLLESFYTESRVVPSMPVLVIKVSCISFKKAEPIRLERHFSQSVPMMIEYVLETESQKKYFADKKSQFILIHAFLHQS